MKLVHTMIGTFSYMRYSYHGDFMIPSVTAGRGLGRKIVLVPNYGHPKKSDQLCLLPDVLLQLPVEGGNKVFRYQDDDKKTN